MACAIMVLVYIWEQSKYDDFHPASDRLYRVYLGFKLIEGNLKTCFNKPRSIVLSRSVAGKLFPEGALGKTLIVENEKKSTVTGNVKELPVEHKIYWTVTG